MLEIDIPGWRRLQLQHLVLDLNGTLTCDGEFLPGIHERIAALTSQLTVQLLTADTFGRLDAIAAELGVRGQRLARGRPEASQKAEIIQGLGPRHVAAIGNGANDVDMLRVAALGIAVLGPEGLATTALTAADVVVASIADGLDLLIHPLRLTATLRR
jgi:P-type E1-E2 ATPase